MTVCRPPSATCRGETPPAGRCRSYKREQGQEMMHQPASWSLVKALIRVQLLRHFLSQLLCVIHICRSRTECRIIYERITRRIHPIQKLEEGFFLSRPAKKLVPSLGEFLLGDFALPQVGD